MKATQYFIEVATSKEIICYAFQLKYLDLIPINYLKVKFTLGEIKERALSNYRLIKQRVNISSVEISENQFLVKNKTIQGQVKVGDKASIVKSEGETSGTRSEQIKDSSHSNRDAQFANKVINSVRNVRANEVARVKAKIKNGYNVDSRDIAEGILKNLLQNS